MTENEFLKAAYCHQEKLLAIAHIRLHNEDDAKDIVSETIIKASKKKDQLRDQSKLLNWLVRILINQCNDLHKKKKKRTSLQQENIKEPEDLRVRIEGRLDVSEQIEKVLDVMLSIEPEEHRDVIVLYFYRKFSYAEIAEMLDIAEGTVKSRIHRAKPALMEKLALAQVTKEDLLLIKDMEAWPNINH